MASNKSKLTRRRLFQTGLFFLGILIIFFTYFYKDEKEALVEKKEPEKKEDIKENVSTFENIQYEGKDANGNDFIINSEDAEFFAEKPNIIYMQKIICRFFFKDGTVLKITSNKGVYDNITNDMEFEENVKMYYLENRLFSDKATFVNSENYLLIQDNVVGTGPQGDLVADKLNIDLLEKKMKISMYNAGKVNIKVNY
tara:strand:+ start:2020 stop:2613 length:594 start_codon:yes stop_codon:yes gene_type:complete